jgi:phosphohistidine swiveling domain-containing protein
MAKPTHELIEFCEQELGSDGPRLAATVLQGFANESTTVGQGLGRLAELAAQHPALADALKQGRYEGLKGIPESEEFLNRLHRYLEEYGGRTEGHFQVHSPTWREEPTRALKLITRFLNSPESSPSIAMRRATAQREETVRGIESGLSPANLARFQTLVAAAKDHVAISESRNFWQDTLLGSLRMPVMALAQKLVALGVIEVPNDVFHLRLYEVKDSIKEPRPLFSLVEQRKAELEKWRQLKPPPFIGPPPPPRPASVEPTIRHFFGSIVASAEANTLKGQAASAGVVKGIARLITSLSDSERLGPGDILVCKATSPSWTPLFAVAAGVVTDVGGILSHTAICAREYAIPCVVATQIATTTIPDGATITVDGSKGTVTIEG